MAQRPARPGARSRSGVGKKKANYRPVEGGGGMRQGPTYRQRADEQESKEAAEKRLAEEAKVTSGRTFGKKGELKQKQAGGPVDDDGPSPFSTHRVTREAAPRPSTGNPMMVAAIVVILFFFTGAAGFSVVTIGGGLYLANNPELYAKLTGTAKKSVKMKGEDTDIDGDDEGGTLVTDEERRRRKIARFGDPNAGPTGPTHADASITLAAAAPKWVSIEVNCPTSGIRRRAQFKGRSPRKAYVSQLPIGERCQVDMQGGAPGRTRLSGGQHVTCSFRGGRDDCG